MSSVFSIYFDGVVVQAVKASISSKSVTIEDARTFPQDELDAFLSACKETSFVLCCNPLLFHQDILYLPPAASRHYDKLIRTELQQIHPEQASFTTFYRTVGLATVDAMEHNKIAAFSYEEAPLSRLISVFNSHNKLISAIYAAPYSVFRLIASTCSANPLPARLFIASLPAEKLFMLGENSELEFIREIPASSAALLPADIQNINMTVDYCFQSLRVKPTEVVMLNQSETSDEQAPMLSLPLISTLPPSLSELPRHILNDYLAPIASAMHYLESPRTGDILPLDYVSFIRNKKVLTITSRVMALFVLLLAGYALTEWMIISDIKSGIRNLKTQLNSSGEELATYRKLDDEVKTLNQRLKLVRTHDPASALAALTLPASKEYAVQSVAVQYGEGVQSVRIEGQISAEGLSGTQIIYETILAEFGKIPGYAVTSSSLDIKQKSFSIQANYKSIGQKSK